MPKKPRFKRESSVVRTEPDHRRATGRDDDDDFEIEETTALEPARKSSGISRYQRSKATNSSLKTDAEDEPFPFMLLPAEIRCVLFEPFFAPHV
jgi:hypothetical protein